VDVDIEKKECSAIKSGLVGERKEIDITCPH
jgi:hypothetical protein